MGKPGRSRVERLSLTGFGIILILFLGIRLGLVPFSWPMVFPLIVAMVVLASLFWWTRVDRLLRGRETASDRTGRRRWWRLAWGAFIAAMFSPLVLWVVGFRGVWDAYPVPAIMWILIWHLLMVGIVAAWVPAAGVRALVRRLRRKRQVVPTGEACSESSRREILVRAIAVAPMLIAGGSCGLAVSQAGRFRVRRVPLRLPRLPDRLKGLTITHLSDVHVGRLFRPEHLPRLVDAVNQLKSDIVAITGDIVDHSIDYLPAACDAFGQMESRYGRFVIIGNHDLMDSPDEAISYLHDREPLLLMDGMRSLLIGGETVQVAGLFWSRYDEPRGSDPGLVGRAATALAGADRRQFTIALAHHPHAFDPLADRGADLTLAGHTHGGQLMLTPPGSRVAIGGGSLLFRYIWGEYRRRDSVLLVTSGVGNWFPVRINAPAEIVQIQLV
jgi:uncharacterized protein